MIPFTFLRPLLPILRSSCLLLILGFLAAGVYVLLPQRSADGHLCYARLPDTFTQDANDGACPFSRTGTLSLSQGGKVDKGTRAGRVAVHADVARLFRNNDCGERPALVLECHGQSGALVGVRDETGRALTMPEPLGQVLNQVQNNDDFTYI